MYIGLHVKTRYSCQILMKLDLRRQIFEVYSSVSSFMEIGAVGADLLLADDRTDRREASGRFS